MTDLNWMDFVIVGFVIGLLFSMGIAIACISHWNEEQSIAVTESYWRGWNDAIAACPDGCGSDGGGGYPPRLKPNVTHCNTSGVCNF